jgi:hypothetical protein
MNATDMPRRMMVGARVAPRNQVPKPQGPAGARRERPSDLTLVFAFWRFSMLVCDRNAITAVHTTP